MNIIKSINNYFKRAKSINNIYDEIREYVEENVEMDSYWWIEGLYYESGKHFAIVAIDGKLEKWTYSFDAYDKVTIQSRETVEITFMSVPETRNIVIQRSADNKTAKFYGICATSVLNRNAEIDSKKLFEYFENNYKENSAYLTFQHLPEKPFKFGSVERVMAYENFLIACGTIDLETELGLKAEKALQSGEWGFSIGFYSRSKEILEIGGAKISVYTSGDLVEISILKESSAASYFTGANYYEEREMKIEKLREVLTEFLGDEDKANELLNKAEGINREITDKGMITRMENNTKEKEVEINLGTDFIDSITEAVSRAVNSKFEEINKKIEEINSKFENVKQEVNDVKETIVDTPNQQRQGNVQVNYRPSQKNNTSSNGETVVMSVKERLTANLESTKIN